MSHIMIGIITVASPPITRRVGSGTLLPSHGRWPYLLAVGFYSHLTCKASRQYIRNKHDIVSCTGVTGTEALLTDTSPRICFVNKYPSQVTRNLLIPTIAIFETQRFMHITVYVVYSHMSATLVYVPMTKCDDAAQ